MRALWLLAMAVSFLMAAPLVAEDKEKDKDKDKDKFDATKLVGTWNYVSGVRDGKKVEADNLKKGSVIFTKDTITLKSDEATFVMKYTLDTKKSPVAVSMEITDGPFGKGEKAQGIIALKGEELKFCYQPMKDKKAPTEFASKEGSGLHYFVLKKKAK
jgi:uncharacterized protein (TIGR03067 family)